MDEILKKLLKSEVLNEETKEAVKKAFEEALAEAKAAQEKKLRAELSERYEKDKKAIHTAIEQYIEQELTEHIKEFRQGVEEVQGLKAKYADKIVSVKEQAKEYTKKRLAKVESVLESILTKELTELHESEKTNRRAYLNAINEVKANEEADRAKFKKKAAAVLENIVNVQISGMLEELREDIKAAQKNDWGREIFEAYYATFRRQFFNSSKEFKGLMEANRKLKGQMNTLVKVAREELAEHQKKAETAEAAKQKLAESYNRTQKMGKLLEGLSGDAKRKMKVILEATKTSELEKTHKKFLADVLNESQPVKKSSNKKLAESVVEITTGGQKNNLVESSTEDDDEIDQIIRRAGVK